ncbi:hypothetical protein [Dactylosporangium cerinum]
MCLELQRLVVGTPGGREEIVQLAGYQRGVIGMCGTGTEQQHATGQTDGTDRPAKPRVHPRKPIWSTNPIVSSTTNPDKVTRQLSIGGDTGRW